MQNIFFYLVQASLHTFLTQPSVSLNLYSSLSLSLSSHQLGNSFLHSSYDSNPTNAMIGGDNSQTRSPWGVQVKQLTKICWHLFCSPILPRLLRQVNLALGLGYFLLQLSDCTMEAYMLLAEVRVHEHW